MRKTHTWKTKWGTGIRAYYRVDKNDWNTLQSCLAEDEYHLNGLDLEGKNVVDIGGHIGGFTLAALAKGANVTAVEVLPENVDMIRDSVGLNAFSGSLNMVHKAIGKTTGEVIKACYNPVPSDKDTENHHEFIGVTTVDTGGASIEVESISLDDVLKDLDEVEVLKIDCEGAEWPAFAGVSPEQIAKVKLIVGEVHPLAEYAGQNLVDLLHGQFEDVSAELGGTGQLIDLICFRRK